jgi:hypothetical protein
MTYPTPVVIAACCTLMAATSASAGTALEEALASGAERLSSDEIAELLVGKRVVARAGDKVFNFHYAPTNVLQGELQGGGWSGTGHYAITDGNEVCVSMAQDAGRYRCLTVLRHGDSLQKFNARGDKTFDLLGTTTASGL